MIAKDMRFGMWVDGQRMREEGPGRCNGTWGRLGALRDVDSGKNLSEGAADLVFQLPQVLEALAIHD